MEKLDLCATDVTGHKASRDPRRRRISWPLVKRRNYLSKVEEKIMLNKIFNREKLEFPVAIVMLAISLFCVFLCIDVVCLMIEHGSGNIWHVLFIGSLVAINAFAVFLNIKRVSHHLKDKLGNKS
jgi:hypothetical protein